MLEVKDACVRYGKSRVVNGISLKIDGAETFLVLGRNGVGKLKNTVGEGGLAVVDMRDNGEISYMFLLFGKSHIYTFEK